MRRYIVKWIVQTNKPFDEVGHEEFWDMMKVANSNVQPFSRRTVRRDLDLMHKFGLLWVKRKLQVS